jgi:Protein of unknown function (DUF4054)
VTVGDFQALFPQFPSPAYDTRIGVLLAAAPLYDGDKLGNQLNLATGLWVADQLAVQDIAIKYGAAGTLTSSSSSSEKQVGKVSIKSSLSQAQGSKGVQAGKTTYGMRLDDLLRECGFGAVAV